MVICDFDFVSIAAFPAKANAPLLIYADTVLPCAVATEGFEAIARREAQVVDLLGRINLS